jgi:hypothetical protein
VSNVALVVAITVTLAVWLAAAYAAMRFAVAFRRHCRANALARVSEFDVID